MNYSRITTTFILLPLLLVGLAAQQGAVVTGRVTDAATGDPLPGANVFIDELNVGAAADADGVYSFSVVAARVRGQEVEVVVRYIGYHRTRTFVTLTPGTITQDFRMEQDVLRLEEVVVTGVVGETPLTKTPFAVDRLRREELELVPAISAEGAIRGKVAGARVTKGLGQPGESASVLLRGVTSINASDRSLEPLYIVDGVILSERAAMADIDAMDIEKVEVVKGAAASSLYGSRAANGVVQFTTSRGKNLPLNKTRITLRTEMGRNELPHKIDMVKYHSFLLADKSYTDSTGHKVEPGDFVTHGWWDSSGVTLPYYKDPPNNKWVWKDGLWIDPRDPAGGYEVDYFGDPSNGIAFQDNPYKYVSTGVPDSLVDGEWKPGYGRDKLKPPDLLPKGGFDHLDRFFKPHGYQTTSISLAQNTPSTNFFASFTNTQEPGVMYATDGNVRNSLRVNLDHSIREALQLSVSTYYSQSTIDEIDATGDAFFDLTFMPPNVDLLKVDETDYERVWLKGQWDPKLGDRAEIFVTPDPLNLEESNPLYALIYQDRTRTRNRFLTNARLIYRPLAWFGLEVNLSLDRTEQAYEFYWPKGYKDPRATAIALGRLDRDSRSYEAVNADATASFVRSFGPLTVRSKLRYLFEQDKSDRTNVSGRDFAVGGVRTLNVAAIEKSSMLSSRTKILAEGYYLIGGADYAGKYIIDFMLRRDGSSLFGAKQRWHNYHRFSGAYRISEEPFWSPLKGTLNEFKLRFSQGTAGSRPAFAAQYETFDVSGGFVSKENLGNKKLIPEFQTETEFGVDLALFDRYSIKLTKANSVVENQILLAPLAGYFGYEAQWQNAGTIESNTIEASLDAMLLQTKDINWSAGLVYDRTTSKITKFNLPAYKSGNYALFYNREGETIGTMYGDARWMTSKDDLKDYYSYVDLNEFDVNDDGYLVWVGKDENGNPYKYTQGISDSLWGTSGTLYNADSSKSAAFRWGIPIAYKDSAGKAFTKIGSTVPDFNFGFSTSFRFRNLSIYALFEGQKGGDIYYATGQWGMREQKVAEVDQAGKPDEKKKPTLYYDQLYYVNAPNSNFVYDGTYLKLRELSVRYSLSLLGQRITLGVIGRNLITWTDYPGYDPEVGRPGGNEGSAVVARYDGWSYPNFRSYALIFEVEL